ncbi:MAG: hypothetical protein ACQCN6_03505 [Candidatus Bathyarchaeia archaeon]
MSKNQNKEITEKTPLKVDSKIIRLFPNLDFTKADLDSKTVGIRRKYLFVLAKAANDGFVTDYNLKKAGLSSQTAINVLKSLIGWGFLKIRITVGKTKRERKEAILTAKGVIACIVISKFQSREKVELLLNGYGCKGSNLAALLKIYNAGYIRGRGTFPYVSESSAIVTLLRDAAADYLVFEQMPDAVLIQSLRRIEAGDHIKPEKVNPFEMMHSLLQGLAENRDAETYFLKTLESYKAQDKTDLEDNKVMARVIETAINSGLSPEILAFSMTSKNRENEQDYRWLLKAAYKRLVDKKIYDRKVDDFKNEKEIFEYLLNSKVKSIKDLPKMVDEFIKAANDAALDFFTHP